MRSPEGVLFSKYCDASIKTGPCRSQFESLGYLPTQTSLISVFLILDSGEKHGICSVYRKMMWKHK